MTTEEAGPVADPAAQKLTEHILRGEDEKAAQSAVEISAQSTDANDVVDTISEAMNIVADLHEVEKYSSEQVENSERAAEKALEAVRPKIRIEQSKITGRVMVVVLEGEPHGFDKTLLLAMLEIGGFTALDGGADASPEQVADMAREMDANVIAVPLVTSQGAKKLRAATSLVSLIPGKVRIVAYGRAATQLSESGHLGAVAEDSLAAISRIAEILMSK